MDEFEQTELKDKVARNEIRAMEAEARMGVLDARVRVLEQQLAAALTLKDEAEYHRDRMRARNDALQFALVLAHANARPIQDKLQKIEREHERCDKLAIAQ